MAFSFFGPNFFSLFDNRAWFSGRAKHLLGWKASITLTGEQSVAKSLHRLSVVRGGIIVGGIIVRPRNFNSRQFRRGWRILHTGGWLLALWCTSVGVDQNAKRSQDAITWDRALPIGQLAQGLLNHVYALGACKSGAEHSSCHLSTSNFWQIA